MLDEFSAGLSLQITFLLRQFPPTLPIASGLLRFVPETESFFCCRHGYLCRIKMMMVTRVDDWDDTDDACRQLRRV